MDDKGKDVLFGKSVIGGFRRRDVIRYIDTLQKQNMRSVQGEEDALRQTKAQVLELTQQLLEANAEIAALRTQLEAARNTPADDPAQADAAQPQAAQSAEVQAQADAAQPQAVQSAEVQAQTDASKAACAPAQPDEPQAHPAERAAAPQSAAPEGSGFFRESQGGQVKKTGLFSRRGRSSGRFF